MSRFFGNCNFLPAAFHAAECDLTHRGVSDRITPMKRFMFVVDDFGMSPEVNRAVELAYRAGAVRRVSLMVKGRAAEEAISIARRSPGMSVGLHLAVDGLIGVDPSVWLGSRSEGLSELVGRASVRDAIARECELQVESFLSLGFGTPFLNSHFHVHTIPALFGLFVDVARSHGFPFVRFSANDRLLVHPDVPISDAELSSMARRLDEEGIRHADWYKPTFCYLYPPEISDGLTEIAFHPAWGDSEVGYLDLARLLSWGSIMRSAGGSEVPD